MNPLWKSYRSKVLKTINPEYEDDTTEEVSEVEMENDLNPVQEDEGPNAVSQLAKKMQGAGAKSWNRLSTLFNKEDEHQLLEETESPPVPDHPLAVKPEEPSRPSRRTGFWDSFATNWAAKKQAEAAAAAGAVNEGATGQEGRGRWRQQRPRMATSHRRTKVKRAELRPTASPNMCLWEEEPVAVKTPPSNGTLSPVNWPS
ncbi:hypothetical protein WMY93_026678 [Mugilogobius chulae]|uniref:Testis development-related protein n=1 Tax=Mugilogobius chulae TaxID=88201 RepID=A0AAW0MY22_9GOBI